MPPLINTINHHPSEDRNILHYHNDDFSWFTTYAQFPLIINGPFFRLPCVVDRLEGFVMLWKKNGEIITVASQIIDKVWDKNDYNDDWYCLNENDYDEEDYDDAEVITEAI